MARSAISVGGRNRALCTRAYLGWEVVRDPMRLRSLHVRKQATRRDELAIASRSLPTSRAETHRSLRAVPLEGEVDRALHATTRLVTHGIDRARGAGPIVSARFSAAL